MLFIVAACSSGSPDDTDAVVAASTTSSNTPASTTSATSATSTTSTTSTTTAPPPTTSQTDARPAPAWLGTRVLPSGPDGVVVPQTTPPELVDRRLLTEDTLPPPPDDGFLASIQTPAPNAVIARSTWTEGCPVPPDELSYLMVGFWGFDDRPHTGELLVHTSVAEELVGIFETLFAARFPIEEMRVVAADELVAPPTGDGNNTTAFVCRPIVGGTVFSQHAFGLAVDINPFHNPYQKGDLVLPELATSYLDRQALPGVIIEGDVVVTAFDALGWDWGGRWNSLLDYQHFSRNGG